MKAMKILIGDLRLAARNVRRNPKRSLVAIFTVCVGIVAFVLADGFIAWIFQEIREATIHSQLGHVQIVRPDYFNKGISDPYAYLLPAFSPDQATIESSPGFRTLAPRLSLNGLISKGEASIPFIGEGVSPAKEKELSSRMEIISGANLSQDDAPEVILGEGLARSIGVSIGDKVVLLATTTSGSTNAIEVTAVGVFATMYKDYDDIALRLPINIARRLMKVSGSNAWIVLFNKTELADTGIHYIENNLDTQYFQVVPWTQLADFYNKTVTLFSKQVSIVKTIIALIIILTISNTQMMNVLERTMEIGTNLALGLHRNAIMRLFLLEGCLVGIAGGTLGVLFGYALAGIISSIGIPMPPPPGMAHGYLGQILVTWPLMFDALLLALLTTLIASLFPAWKASHLNIVDALRCNQ
jgi:putative ABC transport system permease protein